MDACFLNAECTEDTEKKQIPRSVESSGAQKDRFIRNDIFA